MKTVFYLIPALFISCVQPDKKPSNQKAPIAFNELAGKAILIGNNIEALDANFERSSTLKEGDLIQLTGKSDSLFNQTKDYCSAYHYIKARTEHGEVIVDGRKVYQLLNSSQNISFHYQTKKIQLNTARFFGIGVADDDGLTLCSSYYETIVLAEGTQQPQLVKVIKNSFFQKASNNKSFSYFELMANDGAFDKILLVEEMKDGVLLTIKREFQEGQNQYQVKLNLSSTPYTAEYLNYGKTTVE